MERLNVVGIDTPSGYRTVELFHGDLAGGQFNADILVVSAFAGSYAPTQGTLISALSQTYGLDLRTEARRPDFDLRAAFGCWVSHKLETVPHYQRVLVVEMIGAQTPIEDCINHVFVTLAALEAKGEMIKSMAMPVIGTGSQGIPQKQVMPALLQESEAALQSRRFLQRISFVERDKSRASALSAAMDSTLRRAVVSLPKTQLIASLRADLRSTVDHVAERIPASHASLLNELRRLLASETARSFELGVIARRLVEFVVDDLLAKPKTSPDLAKKIDQMAEVRVSPWIRGYMHTIRLLGNESAHEKSSDGRFPPHVSEDDLAVCLFCTHRILVFWSDYRQRPTA